MIKIASSELAKKFLVVLLTGIFLAMLGGLLGIIHLIIIGSIISFIGLFGSIIGKSRGEPTYMIFKTYFRRHDIIPETNWMRTESEQIANSLTREWLISSEGIFFLHTIHYRIRHLLENLGYKITLDNSPAITARNTKYSDKRKWFESHIAGVRLEKTIRKSSLIMIILGATLSLVFLIWIWPLAPIFLVIFVIGLIRLFIKEFIELYVLEEGELQIESLGNIDYVRGILTITVGIKYTHKFQERGSADFGKIADNLGKIVEKYSYQKDYI